MSPFLTGSADLAVILTVVAALTVATWFALDQVSMVPEVRNITKIVLILIAVFIIIIVFVSLMMRSAQ